MGVTGVVRSVVAVPSTVIGMVDGALRTAAVLWGEVEVLVDRFAGVLDRLDPLLDRVELEVGDVQALLGRVRTEVAAVATVITEVHDVAVAAGRTQRIADVQVQRLRGLLDEFEAPLRGLVPLLDQASKELRPAHVSGIAALLDQLPDLVDRLEPALTSMAGLAPEMEQVTERMDSVGAVVEGLPGAKTLRRRGEARAEADEV